MRRGNQKSARSAGLLGHRCDRPSAGPGDRPTTYEATLRVGADVRDEEAGVRQLPTEQSHRRMPTKRRPTKGVKNQPAVIRRQVSPRAVASRLNTPMKWAIMCLLAVIGESPLVARNVEVGAQPRHTSRGSTPSSMACAAVRPPKPVSTWSTTTDAPRTGPNCPSMSSLNSVNRTRPTYAESASASWHTRTGSATSATLAPPAGGLSIAWR